MSAEKPKLVPKLLKKRAPEPSPGPEPTASARLEIPVATGVGTHPQPVPPTVPPEPLHPVTATADTLALLPGAAGKPRLLRKKAPPDAAGIAADAIETGTIPAQSPPAEPTSRKLKAAAVRMDEAASVPASPPEPDAPPKPLVATAPELPPPPASSAPPNPACKEPEPPPAEQRPQAERLPFGVTSEALKQIKKTFQPWLEQATRPPSELVLASAGEMGLDPTVLAKTLKALAGVNLSRPLAFRIEKTWLTLARTWTGGFHALTEAVAEQLGIRSAAVSFWVNFLCGKGGKDPAAEELPSAEFQAAILACYDAYLLGDGPPDQPLHPAIAASLGNQVTANQVFLVLRRLRRKLKRRFQRVDETQKPKATIPEPAAKPPHISQPVPFELTDAVTPGATLMSTPGRIEVTVKFNEIPNYDIIKGKLIRFVVEQGGMWVEVRLKEKAFKKILDMDAAAQHGWVASISGKVEPKTMRLVWLLEPNVQVFEKKPKAEAKSETDASLGK